MHMQWEPLGRVVWGSAAAIVRAADGIPQQIAREPGGNPADLPWISGPLGRKKHAWRPASC